MWTDKQSKAVECCDEDRPHTVDREAENPDTTHKALLG